MNWEERLTFHEGMKLTPYKCAAGKTTIGVGHNCEAREFTDEEKKAIGDWQKGITKNMALMILRNDMEICLKDLRKLGFWYYLDDERRYALLDMCFQLGFQGLSKFKKMLEAIRVKNYSEAYKQCLDSDYARQTPARANRIAKLIRTGKWEI
jgi:lysozyme